MSEVPNAKIVTYHKNGEVTAKYKVISPFGTKLKVKWDARREGGFIEFSPADLKVSINDSPLLIDRLELVLDRDEFPQAKITFTMDQLEVEADTIAALVAYAEQQAIVDATSVDAVH